MASKTLPDTLWTKLFCSLGGPNLLSAWMVSVLLLAIFAGSSLAFSSLAFAEPNYAWPHSSQGQETLQDRFPPPAGFVRKPVPQASFAHWLRGLPMKKEGAKVKLHTGDLKWRQDVHVGIVDIDIGKRDLQQCADAIMRLRAEWLWSANRKADIAFDYTGGGRVPFSRWARGERPSQSGKSWRRSGKHDASYASFRKYMVQIFAYAGTYSLSKELKQVQRSEMRIGDVFIKGGFPGHAVLVADMVENDTTGEKQFLLLQSFMPAQDIHVLKNPQSWGRTPWYDAKFSWPLETPEWTFAEGSLKRWP